MGVLYKLISGTPKLPPPMPISTDMNPTSGDRIARMSKSMKRVSRALADAGIEVEIVELGTARTAQEAAEGVGCHLDQIAKSIIFAGETSGEALLFLTAGGNMVDQAKASALAGEPLCKADAALIRAQTGFAIGGVAPLGHLNPIRAWTDPKLLTPRITFLR